MEMMGIKDIILEYNKLHPILIDLFSREDKQATKTGLTLSEVNMIYRFSRLSMNIISSMAVENQNAKSLFDAAQRFSNASQEFRKIIIGGQLRGQRNAQEDRSV